MHAPPPRAHAPPPRAPAPSPRARAIAPPLSSPTIEPCAQRTSRKLHARTPQPHRLAYPPAHRSLRARAAQRHDAEAQIPAPSHVTLPAGAAAASLSAREGARPPPGQPAQECGAKRGDGGGEIAAAAAEKAAAAAAVAAVIAPSACG
eukprot:5691502-Prymnesium_polylepis.1